MTSIGDDGRSLGPTPMELFLMGMGGCTAYDVVEILEKSREPVEGCVADIDAERAAEDPKVFTRIHVHFTLTGRGLSSTKVERAIRLSAEKYCSASIMLAKTARITHDFEVVEPARA
jgi:putative redox protein